MISEELLEEIVERAAERAAIKTLEMIETKSYTEVGKFFVTKITKVIGMILIGLALYLSKNGIIKLW